MRISDWSSDVCSSDLKEFGSAGGDDRVDGLARFGGAIAELIRPNGIARGIVAERGFIFAGIVIGLAEREMQVQPVVGARVAIGFSGVRSEEHTSELQSLMRISYAVFCLKRNKLNITSPTNYN